MKINFKKLHISKKSCLFILFFSIMLVFASFNKEDRQKVIEFKKGLIHQLNPGNNDLVITDSQHPLNDNENGGNDKLPILKKESDNKIKDSENKSLPRSTEIPITINNNSSVFSSREKQGTIGSFSDKDEDMISDNFFTIDIPVNSKGSSMAYLEYDLFGLATSQSVPRSINHNIAIGGNIIIANANWSHQREQISPNLIKEGSNTVLFTSPAGGVKYKIKNLKIVFEKGKKSANDLIISSILSGNRLYVKGNNTTSKDLHINNEIVEVKNGEFEKTISLSDKEKELGYFSIKTENTINTYQTPKSINSFKVINAEYFNPKRLEISNDKEYDINYENLNIKVEKETSESAYIEVLKLREKDFPTTSQGIKNVTSNNAAYRFTVASGKLNKKIKLSIPYDEKRLGLISPKDIRAFYFDYLQRQWKIESSAIVDEKTKTVTIESSGDNDYINGIISVPESPQINAFAPTSISGLKAGDPSAGVQFMSPPTANQKGDAAMSYPIEIPAGTNGMQPNLAISYNSSKGNSWMGEGWDISGLSGITLDTRWGTPSFDPNYESEIYLLDGEMLVYEGDYLPHRHINTTGTLDITRQLRNGTGKKNFYLRKNNNFTKVERYGVSPSTYTWLVTTTDGTKKYYGGTETGVNNNAAVRNDQSQAIVQWGITKEIDIYNNNIKYYYDNKVFALGQTPVSGENANLAGGHQFHLQSIKYSGKNDVDGPYTINFANKEPTRPDYIINVRDGVKRVEVNRLEVVSVSHLNTVIRDYRLGYTTGEFYKSLLKTITSDGATYQLDYYNDIGGTGGANFAADKSTNAPNTDAFSGTVNGALTPSKIGADNNFEWGWSLRAGVGLGLFKPHRTGDKNFMVSGFIGESYPDVKRGQELIDFNGDGVVDILYRKRNGDNGLKIIPGSLDDLGNLQFTAPQKNILNLKSNFTKTSGSTFNTGATILFNWWKLGFDFTKSWSESESSTPVYLVDANNDGLPDVVKDNKVWFNKINPSGEPEMVTTSDLTENMVIKGNVPVPYTEPADIDDPADEEPVKAKNDVVKVWIAPKAGYITISDNISIAGTVDTAAKAVYSIEVKNPGNLPKNGRVFLTTLSGGSTSIPVYIQRYNDYPGTPLGINNSTRIFVNSGDKVYFRLHKKTGINYIVNTKPSVQYVNSAGVKVPDTPEEEQDTFRPNNLQYEQKFLLNNLTKTLKFDNFGGGTISIPGFTVPRLDDSVTFSITLSKGEITNPVNDIQVVYSKTYPESSGQVQIDAVDMNYFVPPAVPGGWHLKFQVESDSYMAKEIEWKNIYVTKESIKVYDVASYPSYYVKDIKNKFHVSTLPNAPQGTNDYYLSVNKTFSFTPTLAGTFDYVIKRSGHVLAKRSVTISNTGVIESTLHGNVINGVEPILFYSGNPYQTAQLDDKINIVIYCNTQNDRAAYESFRTQLQNKIFNIYYGPNKQLWSSTTETSLNTGEFNSISPIYHNWGQFIYNESKDVKKGNNSLAPPDGPRDIPTAPVATNGPDYVLNPDTPKDTYGALINNDFLDAPFGQFNYNFNSCAGITDENQYADCVGDIIQANFQTMAATNILAGFNPIVPMTTYFKKESSGLVQKWVNNGFSEQYSMPSTFRDEESMAPFYVSDDPDEIDIEVQGNVNTSMYAIEKKQKSKAKTTNWGIGLPVVSTSHSQLRGYGNINTQDFFDVNGDGYPDILYRTQSQLTNSLGGLQNAQGRNLENNPDSVISNDDSFQKTNTIAFSVSAVKTVGRNVNLWDNTRTDTSAAWSGGTSSSSYPDSYDKGLKYWIDINGDGLVDRVEMDGTEFKYKLNYGTGLINNPYEQFPGLDTYNSSPVSSTSVSIGGGLSAMTDTASTFSSGWGISGSVTASASSASTKKTFQDVNGDGMVDLLTVDNNGYVGVSYNMGNKFASSQGLVKLGGTLNLANETKNYNGALTLNGGFYLNVPILTLFGATILYFRAGTDMTANLGVSVSEINKGLRDVNGDGYPDLVVNTSNGLTINYSKIGRTNKLAKVTEKISNGTFSINYQFTKPTYKDPQARLVMSELRIFDPNANSTTYTFSEPTKDIVTRFQYQDSKYDRRERTNYGFAKVIGEDMNGSSTTPYRKTIQTFYNSNYFNNGLLRTNETFIGGGNVLSTSTRYTYKLYKYINNYTQIQEIPASQFESYDTGGTQGNKLALTLPSGNSTTIIENGNSIMNSMVMSYNSKAQLTDYSYLSNVPDGNFTSKILYHNIAALTTKNILDIPSEIKVFDSGNTLKRQRNTEIDQSSGAIKKVIVKLNASQNAETLLTYDTFGNIKSVTDPVGYSLSYTYDPLGKYVIGIKDSFGVISSATYDLKWDSVLESTDATGNKMVYTYDTKGRIASILGPKEVGVSPYSVKYTYFNSPVTINSTAVNFYGSLTQNYDPDHPTNPIETIVLSDFSGKTVQVKKDIEIEGLEKMSVSGMTLYDVFDRPVKQYHATFENKDTVLNKKLKLTLAQYFTLNQYDALDRIISETDEDNNAIDTKYDLENGSLKTTVTQLQNTSIQLKSETLTNMEGRTVLTRKYSAGQPLTTQYVYNNVGQLLQTIDPENIITNYQYDMGGRRTMEEHPDRGMSRYEYDQANQMISKTTANLANAGLSDPFIRYTYAANRLVFVDYPNLPNGMPNPNNVQITYGSTGNDTGRVNLKKDGTGETHYSYGNMGEVVSESRKVIGYNIPGLTFNTSYSYDSWNRLKTIKYPDFEIVRYKYDLGGNLKSMTSDQYGDYIKEIKYDEYEQRTKILNGNDTYSLFTYLPKTRLLRTHTLKKENYTTYLNNDYTYDYVGNIIQNRNTENITPNNLGGSYQLGYSYDDFNRLSHSVGAMLKDIKESPTDPSNISSSFETTLTYNKTSGIKTKIQTHSVSGTLNQTNTYNNTYEYDDGTHKVLGVSNSQTGFIENIKYDFNGNPIYDGTFSTGDKEMFWDEEDNMKAYFSPDEGVFQYYAYDNSGTRTIKYNFMDNIRLYQNGALVDSGMILNGYKIYPNPYVVLGSDDSFTKHYYTGSQRVASRLAPNPGIFGKSSSSISKEGQKKETINPENDFKAYLEKAGLETTKIESEFAKNTAQNGLYYLHSDNLGTVNFVTDDNAVATQFFLNLPFGETFVEQQIQGKYENPYKFNAKELDSETGLYYYGARYYNPRLSIWYGVDPLAEGAPDWSPYAYGFNNPIKYSDPSGMVPEDTVDFDGQDCCQNLKGFALTMVDNVMGSNFRNKYASNSQLYREGVKTGHDASLVLSALMAVDGVTSIGGGTGGLTLSTVASSTGVGTPVGGIGAALSGVAIAKGTIEVAGSAVILNNTLKNKLSDQKVNSSPAKKGRNGKQARLRELADDPKEASSNRGWLKNEIRHIKNGNRKTIRNPRNSRNSKTRGTELAHPRKQRAKDGFGYQKAKFQDADLHKLEHKYGGYK